MIKELKKLVEIENKYNLYESRIAGVPVWMYIRYLILREDLLRKALGREQSQKSLRGNPKEIFLRFFKVCFDDLSSRKNLKHSDLLLISHERRVKIDGFYRCVYTDEIAHAYHALQMSVLRQDEYRSEKIPENTVYVGLATVFGELYYMFYKILNRKKYQRLLSEISTAWENPIREMEKALGVSADWKKLVDFAAKRVIMTPISRRYLSRYLLKIRPKCIVETVAYEWNRILINEIAHEQGIPVIELQHGANGPDHVAYQYGTDARLIQLPDYLYTYSEFWNETVHMPKQSTLCVAVGYPFFEHQIKKYEKVSSETLSTVRILFISQPTEGKHLSEAAVYCLDHLDSSVYEIIYKLHPQEYDLWKETYPWLYERTDTNLRVIADNRESIYTYQAQCSIQIGAYSTAIYEGLGFHLITILYLTESDELVSPLIDGGYATVANSPEHLVEQISNSHKTDIRSNIQNPFWKMNSLSNIKNELDKILTNRQAENIA